MHFYKYHGLGNDYLVLDPHHLPCPLCNGLKPVWAAAICQRTRGIGADGIVFGPLKYNGEAPGPSSPNRFAYQIWNPDGSQAEVSGNGLRIFARYLLEAGYVVAEAGRAPLGCALYNGARRVVVVYGADVDAPIRIGLGRARVVERAATARSLGLPEGEAQRLGEAILVDVGNPHCVFFPAPPRPIDQLLTMRIGPKVERATRFPRRTNVQLARALSTHHLAIQIWERGAGYTEASGSSSCAAAVAAVASGRCQSPVTVHMPGGALDVSLQAEGDDWQVTLTGPVTPVGRGEFATQWLEKLPTG